MSFFYVCMCCTCSSLCFPSHLADSVNLCGNSGAAIRLPAPVCSGLTPEIVVYSHPCRHGGFCLLGQESSVHCEICSSIHFSVYCDVTQECRGCFCWFLCRMFLGIVCKMVFAVRCALKRCRIWKRPLFYGRGSGLLLLQSWYNSHTGCTEYCYKLSE